MGKYLIILTFISSGCYFKNEKKLNFQPTYNELRAKQEKESQKQINFDDFQIQINSVPHPFNISGSYVVWVNKKRVKLGRSQVNFLAKTLNLSLERPKDTAELHNGNGWIRPFEINE